MKKIIALLFSCSLLLMKVQAQSTTASPYCAPTYSNGNSSNDYINAVQLGAINNVSGPSSALPNYTYFNNLSCATLSIGVTYNMSVQCGTYFTNNNIYAWIDWNHNNIFDPGEMIGSVLNMSGSQTSTITFTVPVTAFPGNTRMRVREIYGSSVIPDPCNNFNFGETEDYCITVPALGPYDIATTAITSPTTGCSLTNQEVITASFFNAGNDTIYSFKAFYNINGGLQIDSEIVNDTILPLQSYSYSFSTLANLSTLGSETILAYAHLLNDTFPLDDSFTTTIQNYSSINSFTFIENCNGASLSSNARVNTGANAQAFLSPIARNTGAGGYLMTGSSSYVYPGYWQTPSPNQVWSMNSNYGSTIDYCVDARNLAGGCGLELKFDLKQTAGYYSGGSSDIYNSSFRVLINGVQISPTYHPSVGNLYTTNDPFVTYTFNLQQYIGTGFNLTFESRCAYDSIYYGAVPGDNVYLDNIYIGPHPPIDIATIKVIEPIDGCGHTASDSVKVLFQDLGCTTIAQGATIPLSYQFGNNSVVTENYTAPYAIHLGDSILYTFHTTVNALTPNSYSLKAFPSMPADSDATDDTLVNVFLAQPTITTYPWTEGFEGPNVFWLSKSINSSAPWVYSLPPALTTMNSPYIGPHGGSHLAYYPYSNGNNSQADLESPCLDFSNLNQPVMRFYLGQYGFGSYAGIKVYASSNGGATYTQLDSLSVINTIVNYPGIWQQVQVCLNNYAHQPNVKVKFRSNAYNYNDIGIDDITILDGTDTSSASVSADTICTGMNVTVSVKHSLVGRTYTLVNQHGAIVVAPKQGTGYALNFQTFGLTQDTILKIAYNDSIPYSYCSSILKDTFFIKVYPYTIANAGANTSFCSGSSITLNGTGGVFYQWVPSVGLSNVNIANPVASPTSTTTYILFADNQGHCGSFDTIVVTRKPSPIANAGVNKLLCYNGSSCVQIGGGPTASGGSGFYTYSWTPTTGIIPAIANPCASPSVTTTYTIVVHDNNGCKDTASATVIVDPQITHTLTTNNVSCFGNTNGSASVIANGGTAPYHYSWGTGSGQTGTSVINLSPNTYTILITDTLGCFLLDTFTIAQPASVSVLLNTFNTTCGQCNGKIVPIVVGGTPNYTYSWSNGSTNDSLLNACNASYTLLVTDSKGCSATDSTLVTGPNGSNTFSVDAGNNLQICSGELAVVGGLPTLYGGTLPYTFVWTPSISLNDTTLSNPIANPTNTTVYHVTATDANGCTHSDSVVVIVHSNPVANAGSDLTYCKLANATLGATPVNGITYRWAPSTGLSAINVANPTVNITATIVYTVTATNTYGCYDTDQVIVTVNPEPLINAGSDVIIYNGNSTTLNATGAVNYTWAPPTGLNSTIGASVTANPGSTTTYVVTGTNSFGCTSTDTVVVYVVATGIDEISEKINLKIYPNPFVQLANIEYSLPTYETVNILLFNVSGRLEKTLANEKQEAGLHKISLNTEELSSGNYLLYIKTNDGLVVKKIIKQQ